MQQAYKCTFFMSPSHSPFILTKQIDYRKFCCSLKNNLDNFLFPFFNECAWLCRGFALFFLSSFDAQHSEAFFLFSSIHNNNNMKGEQNVTSACFFFACILQASGFLTQLNRWYFSHNIVRTRSRKKRYLCTQSGAEMRKKEKETTRSKKDTLFEFFRLFSIAPFVFCAFFFFLIACNLL